MAYKTVYIVTGSIGPDFKPKYFSSKRKAQNYSGNIKRYAKEYDIMPRYNPVIEKRTINYIDITLFNIKIN
jgi:hypothetical protein